MHILFFAQTLILLIAAAFILVMVQHVKRFLRDYDRLLVEHDRLSKSFKVEREIHDELLNEVIKLIPDEGVRASFQGAMALGRLNADLKHAENNQNKRPKE